MGGRPMSAPTHTRFGFLIVGAALVFSVVVIVVLAAL